MPLVALHGRPLEMGNIAIGDAGGIFQPVHEGPEAAAQNDGDFRAHAHAWFEKFDHILDLLHYRRMLIHGLRSNSIPAADQIMIRFGDSIEEFTKDLEIAGCCYV